MASGFRDLDLATLEVPRRHQYLLGAVAPRPIALVGTVNARGDANLAPFSFFNCFSSNPPVLVVSPALSGRDASTKDTLANVLATRELTVSVVDSSLADQANLASCPYPHGTDEFAMAGLTKLASARVMAPGVAESPAVLECRLREHVGLGDGKAAGQLLLVDVVHMRVREEILDADGLIDPRRIDQVARMGGEWYTRAVPGLFELAKPPARGIGVPALPEAIRSSRVLAGRHLARLALVETVPAPDAGFAGRSGLQGQALPRLMEICRQYLDEGRVAEAWQVVHLAKAQAVGSKGAEA